MLETHKARCVLRSFEEDVKDEDVFAGTTMTASVRMLLPQATDLRNEGYTVFTADVKTAFVNAHMKDGDVVYANPPPEWQPETLEPSKGTVILATTVKSLWPEKRTETLARPSRADPQEVRLRPEHAGHLPVDTHDEASITRIPRGRLVVGWNAPDNQGNPHWIESRPGAQEQRGDDKTNARLGTNFGKKRRVQLLGVDASYVESMLEEFNMSARAHQHCAGNAVRKMRKRFLQGNKESSNNMLENWPS